MTDRGLPSADASSACPFVAFEDERDERADRPDQRHRCYAEAEPAPRALAHQEAYCLSSAFPVCPVFQDWARREAAHARAGGGAATAPPAMPEQAATVTGEADQTDRDGDDDRWRPPDESSVDAIPRRNPPRDWAAPPPWAPGAGRNGGRAGEGSTQGTGFAAPHPTEGQGLAGSAADRMTGSGEIDPRSASRVEPRGRTVVDHPSSPADPELAGLVGAAGGAGGTGGAATGRAVRGERSAPDGYPPVARSGRRPAVSSTRDHDRDRAAPAAGSSGYGDGPVWERQRRYEAYPQIKTRVGMPPLPRVVVMAGALALAAVALFFLPALFGGGADNPGVGASPSPTAAIATPSPDPTPVPAPTPQVYVVEAGDTLSRIATSFGLTVDELLAANKDTIENPNLISVGDEIIIPVPPPDEVDGGSPDPSSSPSP